MTAYEILETRFRRIAALREAAGVLRWDMSTLMPDGGAGARGEQLAVLDVLSHELITAPQVEQELGLAEEHELGPWQRANLREMRRHWAHAAAVPAELVEALSKAANRC
ncbi:MAG: carboxypeptidase M32, partial [Kiloniellales bacterium]|nr:carboxypeptidase M32 [Kiloniellales bacterium]